MKNFLKKLLCLFLCLTCLSGCAAGRTPTSSVEENELPPQVTAGGVPLPEQCDRAAVLFSSLADIWVSVGGSLTATVGETAERGFCDESVPLVDEGAGKSINTEALLASSPTLVIGSADIPAQADALKLLEEAGIPTALVKMESFTDYLAVLNWMAGMTGNTDIGEFAVDLSLRVDEILSSQRAEACRGKTVLFLRTGSSASSCKAKSSEDHFAAEMLSEFGCVNLADEVPVLLDGLSMETVLEQDPDYIFISLMGDEEAARNYAEEFLSLPEWQALTAVKEGRVIILPKSLFHFKPNASWPEAYEYLLDVLSGEQAEP